MPTSSKLKAAFYAQDTQVVARQLLGKTLVRKFESGEVARGIVVEVEAYLASGDEASHSFGGLKNSNASMFEAAGTLYVYPIHSRYCLNVVTEVSGLGAAVLVRAVEPLNLLPLLGVQRKFSEQKLVDLQIRKRSTAIDLTRGPGRTCQALHVDRQLDGVDLARDARIWFEEADSEVQRCEWSISRGPRIGISRSKEELLRFFIDGNHFVSGCARDHRSGRNMTFATWVAPR